MAFDPELKAMCIFEVWLADVVSRSEGTETLGSASKVMAYVEEVESESGVGHGLATGASGRERSTKTFVVFDAADYDVKKRLTRIWLPEVDQTNLKLARQLSRVEKLPDVENGGYSHYEIEV